MSKAKNVKWKGIVLVLIAILFSIRIGYIAIRGEVDKAYYKSYSYDLSETAPVPCTNISVTFTAIQNKLDSLELLFDGIEDDEDGAITICIHSEDALLYQTNVELANIDNLEWKKILVNAPLKMGNTYKININVSEECTQIPDVLVTNSGYATEILESYSDEQKINGNVVINFGYLRFPGRADRMVMISLWIIFYLVLFFVISNIEMIIAYFLKTKKELLANVNENIFRYILELLCCLVIVNCSGIEFQEMTKVIFYALSFIAVVNNDKKKSYIGGMLNKTWKGVLLALVYLYASFALVGQRILIYPLTIKLTFEGIFVLVCTTIWFIPVINSILFYMEQVAKHAFGKTFNLKTWQFIFIHVLILLLPAAYNLFANNPGISSSDTRASMIDNAQHLYGMYDWHPAFYCMVLRGIQDIWNSTYAVIAVQYFFWGYVMLELLMYLKKKGLSDIAILAISIFCGFNAANFIHINTIWKDIPYTLSLLWVFLLVTKLSFDFEEYKGKWYIYLELVVALVGVFFYRKNGIVSFIIIAVVLLIFLRKNKKVLVSLLISAVLIGIVKGPIYSHYQVEDPGVRGMYHGLGLDILGAYYSGGEISENTLQMINMMTAYNNAEYEYNPTWSKQSYDVDVEPKTFIINYIDTFVKNPIIMIRAIIAREDALWDIYDGEDAILGCVNYTGTMDGKKNWNDYYSKRTYRSLYSAMSSATAYTADTQWIAAIVWRGGLFSLLGLICTVWLIIRYGKGKHLVIISPILGHIMGLLLSTGWSDFRYFWPLNLLNFSLILLTIVFIRHKEQEKRI